MTHTLRTIAAGALALVLAGAASAQPGAPGDAGMLRLHRAAAMHAPGGIGPGRFGFFGLPGIPGFGGAIGTEIEVRVYDEAPAEGVEPTETLTLTVGEDSEAAFAEAVAAAREDAAYLVIETGPQTHAIDLPDDAGTGGAGASRGRDLSLRAAMHPGMLEYGDTFTATFYDGNPDAGGTELQSLSFTYGEDSAIGFWNDVAEAAEGADWMVLTTPPSSRTVDLSASLHPGMDRDGAVRLHRHGPGFAFRLDRR